MKNITLFVFLTLIHILSAQDCVDDPTGAYNGFGGCETVINTFGMACDASFGGYIVGDICPVLCGASPADDPTGAYSAFGGCETVINTFGMACDADFAGYTVGNICMTTCGTCGGSGPTGCDLPDMSLSVLDDGSVLYNTSAAIGGFQFILDGADLNGASGGDAEDVGFQISINPASGMMITPERPIDLRNI